MATLLGVRKGVDALTSASNVERRRWRQLVLARRVHCQQNFRDDCRTLLFFVEDGRNNDYLTYPDEETYLREGLSLDPATCAAVANYLRKHGEKAISFENAEVEAARLLEVSASERGKKGGRGNKATSETKEVYGETREHIISELKTHAPSIAKRFARGEFKSAAAARREAVRQGLLKPRKQRTTLQVLRAAWKKATSDERATFRAEISAQQECAA